MDKTILVLGAGTGGIITARKLRNLLPSKSGHKFRIVLIEKEEQSIFAPSLLWVMVGMRKPSQVVRPTKKLSKWGIELVIGTIEAVDPASKTVVVNRQEYRGDYLVISMGAETTTEHNLDRIGFNFYNLTGAEGFYSQLQDFKGGTIAVLVPSLPFKCPAAPYEAALLIHDFVKRKGLADQSEISIYTPELGPMPVAGKEISDQVRGMIESTGIKYFPEHQLVSVNDRTLTFQNSSSFQADLVAYTPKHQCPAVIRQTVLAGNSGWIEVNRHTLETSFSDVYALGDITTIPLEIGKPLPKAGVFAHAQAEIVAHNIAQKIKNKSDFKTFSGFGQCFLESGSRKAGFASGNFYASPRPVMQLKKPGFLWHWLKIAFEKFWWYTNF